MPILGDWMWGRQGEAKCVRIRMRDGEREEGEKEIELTCSINIFQRKLYELCNFAGMSCTSWTYFMISSIPLTLNVSSCDCSLFFVSVLLFLLFSPRSSSLSFLVLIIFFLLLFFFSIHVISSLFHSNKCVATLTIRNNAVEYVYLRKTQSLLCKNIDFCPAVYDSMVLK